MFPFKRINKPFSQCFFCLLERNNQKNLGFKRYHNEKETSNYLDKLIQSYQNQLFFNSVVESKQIKCGYKQNSRNMTNRLRYEERVATVLKTIRPLPLAIRYLEENDAKKYRIINQEINKEEAESSETSAKFPDSVFISGTNHSDKSIGALAENKMFPRKKLTNENIENWMTSYDNYEYDLVPNECETISKDIDELKVNYGTPNPDCEVSSCPCGGCGANLHCMDTAKPGYIPSEIFENCFKPGGTNLKTILCQRCHFLKEYGIALQVNVSSDDYPQVLQNISFESALVVLMVDLTDFPCSIWPGIADILGPKTPIIVVGNKVDTLPKDSDKFLSRVEEVLYNNIRLCGFATASIKHIEVVSAKTGYGVENLITSILRIWKQKGDVYLIGCANVGKSSLFNALLQSDFCKIQAADLIQRATTSPWPGTTLDLLKFPITNLLGYRSFLREKRLKKLRTIEAQERNLQTENLKENNSAKNATLTGRIERSFDKHKLEHEPQDSFSLQGNSNLSGKGKLGIDERHSDFAYGKWCFDTPGVVHPGTILHLLTTEELTHVLPKQVIRPETFCVKPGTSLFIAGLARLDYVEGPNPIRLTVFKANELPITLCKVDKADCLYKSLLGSELLLIPIDKSDRLTKWPGLELTKSFKLIGKSWKESSYDVVMSSAGWIAINCGPYEYEFQAWTPEKRGVYVRDCLLPKAVTLRGPRIRYSMAYKKNKFV